MAKPSRWAPETEADIEAARAASLLEETHHLDFKAEVDQSKGGNNELARDLAQFAVDSGALLIGVAEDENKKPILKPIDLAGLPERIEQVAQSTVDPPLFVTTRIIESDDPTKGYVWVDIHASSTAPHQVGGVYYGRGDKTRIRLSDIEVRRLHRQQQASEHVALDEVRRYVDRDPVRPGDRKQAHLFIVAVPATPRYEMLLDVVAGPDRHSLMQSLISKGARSSGSSDRFSPSLHQATSLSRRADGAAMTSGALGPDRSVDTQNYRSESFIEFEMSDEGAVRVMSSRFSDSLYSQPDQQVLMETMLPVLVRQTVDIAGEVSEHVNYGGQWHFAVVANGIAGLPAHLNNNYDLGDVRVPSDLTKYEASTSASTREVLDEPWAVASRLAGRFVRSLGVGQLRDVKQMLESPTV